MQSSRSSILPAPVFTHSGETVFSGEKGDYHDAGNVAALSLAAGTIAMTFNADHGFRTAGALSKDGRGYDEGGHLTVWLKNGEIIVRPADRRSHRVSQGSRPEDRKDTDYHLAVSFGEDGLNVYVNGQLWAAEPEMKQGMDMNERSFLVGASGAWRSSDRPDRAPAVQGHHRKRHGL